MSRNGSSLSFSLVLLRSKDFLSYPQQSSRRVLWAKSGSHVQVAEEAARVNVWNLSTANVMWIFLAEGKKEARNCSWVKQLTIYVRENSGSTRMDICSNFKVCKNLCRLGKHVMFLNDR